MTIISVLNAIDWALINFNGSPALEVGSESYKSLLLSTTFWKTLTCRLGDVA